MPSLQQAERSHPAPLRRKAPKTAPEREAPPTPTPPSTTPTQQEKEGKTNLPQMDQNDNAWETHKRTPQDHKRPLRREGRLWFSINAVYNFGPKTIKLFMILRGFR